MNDPLKDFVERHREDFDHLDAPEFNLDGFKKISTPYKGKKVFKLDLSKWLVAASILCIVAIGVLIFNSAKQTTPTHQAVLKVDSSIKQPQINKTPQLVKKEALADTKKEHDQVKIAQAPKNPKILTKPKLTDVYAGLNDSSSASNRLAAILTIDKSGLISEGTINKLAKTLQYDGNSNVRLAALGIMQNYKDDAHVTNILVNALSQQQDPMVQLALVNLLGTMKNVKIEESLYALVSSPETFNAVKDEAYTILMKENKL